MATQTFDFRRLRTNTTKEEAHYLLEAQGEILQFGHTDRVCPRCGSELTYVEGDSWATTYCKDKGCTQVTCKGI
jgi:NADH pyrophosphatase NudC (nudix superfamily)